MNDVIVLDQLSHTYPAVGRSGSPRQALREVSFSIHQGELFGLLGPNGGGKSTTFNILSTFFPSTGGKATMFGHDVKKEPEQVRHRIGVVFQHPSLDVQLSVWENLIHQGHLYGLAGDELRDRIATVLQRVGLLDRAQDRVKTLSGGLKRRVEVAKGLLHKPNILLLDEPSTGLDPGARRDLWEYLHELRTQEKMTIVVTTHLMEEAEKCDRVAILNQGQLVALGTPTELKHKIGGDVITVQSADPEKLARDIQAKFQAKAEVVDDTVRIEQERGHEFIPQLVTAFPGQITSVTLGKPTLEDVFVRETGHRFWTMDEAPAPEKKKRS